MLGVYGLPVTELKYLEYISRVRNTAVIMIRQWRNNQTASKNIQSTNEQHVNSVQYTISRDCPTNESQGELMGEFTWKPRGTACIESTQIRWFSRLSPGRLSRMSGCQKKLKVRPSGSSPQTLDGSRDGQAGRLNCCEVVAKALKTKQKLKGCHQDWVHSDQRFLVMARQECWTGWPVV